MTVLQSRYLQCLYFFRRPEPGAGEEVEADISRPGGARSSDQRAQALGLSASGNFGSGYAALNNYSEESIMLAKILRLRVCSVFQDLPLWQRAVWSEQCGLWSVIFDNRR